ncbi:MAG: hypothetical protein HYV27_20415 [Candidatus Hydrogenedentes bacterium]|nr:hypothetical protein [Candidatus Hydrogenedentota bacterium]
MITAGYPIREKLDAQVGKWVSPMALVVAEKDPAPDATPVAPPNGAALRPEAWGPVERAVLQDRGRNADPEVRQGSEGQDGSSSTEGRRIGRPGRRGAVLINNRR